MNKSFTLIEILVVIVIIGILSAFIIVSMAGVSEKANIAKGQAFSNSLKNALLLGLTSEWKLNGPTAAGSPATVDDIKDSWTTNNGVLCTAGGIFPHPTPTVRSGADCVSGNCLEFDNIDDQYYVNNPNLRYIGAGMTLEAWIKINPSASNEAYIFSKPWNSNGYYNYRFHYSNDVLYFYLGGDTGQTKTISASNIQKNKWYNVAATVDSGKLMKIFVNGAVVASDTHAITTWIPSAGGGDQNLALSIGHMYRCDQSVPAQIFHGHMDELRYFSEAVPASRVKENYYSGLNKLLANSGIENQEYGLRINELMAQN